MIHVSAPGRGGIIGNPSDIYGGTVVSCTIPERAEAVVSPSPKLIFDIQGHYQVLQSEADLEFDPQLHFLDVAKAVWRYLRRSAYAQSGRLDPSATFMVRAHSNIPLKAGCAGSTAMLMCVLAGILALHDLHLSPYELAELARHIERHELGVHCGYQDQYMIAFGGLNAIDLRDKEEHREGREVPFATVEPLAAYVSELPFILANTGIQRHSGEFHARPRKRWEQGDPRWRAGFARLGELGRLGKKALLLRDWDWLGELMWENYRLVDDLIGCGEANVRLIEAARRFGAKGAKLSGAGRGGTIIALHEDPDWLGQRLLEAGAERLLRLQPCPGLTITRLSS
jgi:galactokinase/mevalonate kinase-like predicted kinase